MPIIGATELQPVNILGSYVQGLEAGRANQLARAQQAAEARKAQREAELQNYLQSADLTQPQARNQLLQFGPAGAEMAQRLATIGAQTAQQGASEAAREKSLLETDTMRKQQSRTQLSEAIQLVTAASEKTYPQIYQQAVEKYGEEELNKLGLTPQYNSELLGSLGQSLITNKERVDQSLRAREARAAEGRLYADQARAQLDARRVDLEAQRLELDRFKASPEYREVTIDSKTRAAREKVFPNANAAFRSATNDIDRLIQDLKTLEAHPGLASITGGIEGRTPSVRKESTAAQALLDKILAKGQFRSLQALRDASPTGGAVGNVSDKEGQALRDSFGALSQTQQDEDFREQIRATIGDLEFSKRNITAAIEDEYAYRGFKAPTKGADTPALPSAPAGKGKTAGGTSYQIIED